MLLPLAPPYSDQPRCLYLRTTYSSSQPAFARPRSVKPDRLLERNRDEVLHKRWHHDIWEVGTWLGQVYAGKHNYYAVPGSSRYIGAFRRRLQCLWMRALRRRSQRPYFSWRRLERMTEPLWSPASIRHPWPDQRFAIKHPR